MLLFLACATGEPGKPAGTDSVEAVDADADGYVRGEDCDDADPAVNPDAIEVCNGHDDDCDALVDDDDNGVEGGAAWYTDPDRDGWGSTTQEACEEPPGSAARGGDCDETDPSVHPDAVETCNGQDDDCDGVADEACGAAPAGEMTADDAQAVIRGSCLDSHAGTALALADLDADGLPDVVTKASCEEDDSRRVGAAAPFAPEFTIEYEVGSVIATSEAAGPSGIHRLSVADLHGDGISDLLADTQLGAYEGGWQALLFRDAGWGMTTDDADLTILLEMPGEDSIEEEWFANAAAIPGSTGAVVLSGSWLVEVDWAKCDVWVAPGDAEGIVGTNSLETLGPDTGCGSAYFPLVPAPAGDLDGDGEGDLLLRYGQLADVYLGPLYPAGTERPADVHLAPETSGDAAFDLSFKTSTVVDLDHDGRDDLLVFALREDLSSGVKNWATFRVDIASPDPVDCDAPLVSFPDWEIPACGGIEALDADGDGAVDLAVADCTRDEPYSRAGAVYLEYGPFGGTRIVGEGGAVLRGTEENQAFGVSLAAGDTNGDGWDDLVIGSEEGTWDDDPGSIYVFLGGPRASFR